MMRLKSDFLDIGENISLENDNHVETVILPICKSTDVKSMLEHNRSE